MSLDTIEPDARAKALDEREKWEIEKLKAETEQIRRPRGRIVSTLGTGLAAVVTLLGAGFTYQLNSLRNENALLEKSTIELQKQTLLADIGALEKDEQQVQDRLASAKKELDAVQTALQTAAATAPVAVAQDAITRAQSNVQILQNENDQSRRAQEQRATRLGEMKGRIQNPRNLRVVP
jgi:hypothetical protein